jgi:hypothetical protein
MSSFAWKIRIHPQHWRIETFVLNRGNRRIRKFKPTPSGWKYTSARVQRIYVVNRLPWYHSRFFKFLRDRRR